MTTLPVVFVLGLHTLNLLVSSLRCNAQVDMNPNFMYPKYWNKIEYRTCVSSKISHVRSLSVGLKAISNHRLAIGWWSTISIPRIGEKKTYAILALTM